MPSQISQLPESQGLIVLPLAKYSYATVSADYTAPLPWTHISENKLFAVFVTTRTQVAAEIEDQQRFRIVRDSQGSTVEDIDLAELARQARHEVDRMKVLKTAQGPDVHVIIRPPTMAMRFPWANGQIHRFQIRFSQEQDYYRALSMFAAVGCPLNEAGASSPSKGTSRPVSALPSIGRPSELKSSANYSRPVTVGTTHSTSSPTRHNNDIRAMDTVANLRESHGVSGDHQTRPAEDQNDFIENTTAGGLVETEHAPCKNKVFSYRATEIGSMAAVEAIEQDSTELRRKVLSQDPALNYSNESHDFNSVQSHLSHSGTVRGRVSQFSEKFGGGDYSHNILPGGEVPSSSAPGGLNVSNHDPDLATSSQQRRLQNIIYQPQPSTAPEYRSQTHMLPPRRELPFARPTEEPKPPLVTSAHTPTNDLSTTKAALDKQKRPSTDIREPDPSLKLIADQEHQSPAKRSRKVPARKKTTPAPRKATVTRRKAAEAKAKTKATVPSVEELLQQQETVVNLQDSRVQHQDSPAPTTTSKGDNKTLNGVPSKDPIGGRIEPRETRSRASLPSNYRMSDPVVLDDRINSAMDDVVFDSQEGYQRPTNEPKASVPDFPKQSRAPLQPQSSNISPTKPMPKASHTVTRAMQTRFNDSCLSASSQIDKFATLPEIERRAALETFMCEQLENPAFHTLCKDMSKMWQTVFFGRKLEEN